MEKISTRSKRMKPVNSERVNENACKWEAETTKISSETSKPKTKSLPARRHRPPRIRRKKHISADSAVSEIESNSSSIKDDSCQKNECIIVKTESDDILNDRSEFNPGNEMEGNQSTGIILTNVKSLRGTAEGDCFDDPVNTDDDEAEPGGGDGESVMDPSLTSYSSHKCGHDKVYKCNECPSSFSTKHKLIVHLRVHTGEKPFKCGVCGKQFAQTVTLQTHMAMHLDHKEHLCEQCGKGFRQKSQLRLHMKWHEGIRKFQCDTCPLKFLTKADLGRHSRRHSDERPFVCKLCGKGFKRQPNLNEHMKRHKAKVCKVIAA
ncbi:Zinc finger and SCAN domain-containing protein 5B [Chamberlinius hualienensis]